MKRLYPLIMSLTFFFSTFVRPGVARADLFGGDVAVLAQILNQAIQTLMVLRQTLAIAKGDSDLLRQVNRDIEKALGEIHAIQDTVRETNEVGSAKDPVEIINRVRNIYGRIPRLGNNHILEFADRASGIALAVDNDTYSHAGTIDSAAISLQAQARHASPGRATQLTAQSQSIMLHSMAQLERTNANLLRVSAAELSMKNTENKNQIESFDEGFMAMTRSKANEKSDLTLESL